MDRAVGSYACETMRTRIYLDHASTSWPKAAGVVRAVARAIDEPLGTPGRGMHGPAESAARVLRSLREAFLPIVGTNEPERIVLTSGATASLNMAVLGMLAHRQDRPRVVTTAAEHNALRRPLEALAARGVIELVTVACDTGCRVDAIALTRAIDDRTALVAMTHASNVTGALQPVAEVAAALRARSRDGKPTPLLLVDASQTAGLVPLEVDRLGIDLAAFSGHKALGGPAGTGVLYVGPRALGGGNSAARAAEHTLRPVFFGGTGHDSQSADMPSGLPERFEPGTPNLPGFAGLLAAVEGWSASSAARALEHGRGLIERFRRTLSERAPGRIVVHGPSDRSNTVPVIALSVVGMDPADAAVALEQSFGILVRSGLHCAPGAHAAMGTAANGGTLRISPGPGTTEDEIDAAADALVELSRASAG